MNLRKWLETNKMTLGEMGRRLNVHRSYLYYLMKGKKTVGPKTMALIREITQNMVNTSEDLLDGR